jgi:hypothetical protein
MLEYEVSLINECIAMARRNKSFRLVMHDEERRLLARVAKDLQRSDSDALRWLVATYAKGLPAESTIGGAKNHDPQPQLSSK